MKITFFQNKLKPQRAIFVLLNEVEKWAAIPQRITKKPYRNIEYFVLDAFDDDYCLQDYFNCLIFVGIPVQFMYKKRSTSTLAGIEPATFGLEVQRAIQCAKGSNENPLLSDAPTKAANRKTLTVMNDDEWPTL